MINIQIYNHQNRYVSADLPPNASISMEDNNPVFAKDFLEGTFSMPITLPLSSHNQQLFRFAENLHVASRAKAKYKARLFLQGIPLFDGEVILRGVSTNGYRVNFQSKGSLLTAAFGDVKLKDLAHTVYELEQADGTPINQFNKSLSIEVADLANLPNPITITINGDAFESMEDADSATRLNDICAKIGASGKYNAHYTPNPLLAGEGVLLHIENVAPGIEAPLQVEADNAWQYNTSWATSYNLKIEPVLNAFFNQLTDSFMGFPVMRNVEHFKQLFEDNKVFLNYTLNLPNYEHTGFSLFQAGKEKANIGLLPCFNLYYVMVKIKESTGISMDGFLAENPELANLMLHNTHAINYVEKIFNEVPVSTFAPRINPADHLPDMTVMEFLLNLKKLFGLSYEYKEESKHIRFYKLRDTLGNGSYFEHTDKCGPDYEFTYKEEPGVVIGYQAEEEETPEELVIGSGGEDFRSAFGYIKAEVLPSDARYGSDWKIPVSREEGRWHGQEPKNKARLFFYYGNKPDSMGYNYAFASHDNYDLQGNRLKEITLELAGADGIYENFLKKIADVLAYSDPIERTLYWNMLDLSRFHYEQKYRINQVNYLIKKMSIQASSRMGLLPIKAELVRVD